MSEAALKTTPVRPPSWRSYYELCKPRVVALIVFTALVGMLLASPSVESWATILFGCIGIGLSAAAGAAINHWVDRKIDLVMIRTSRRPLPKGELAPNAALIFALGLTALSMLILLTQVNTITALLTLVSLIGYAVIAVPTGIVTAELTLGEQLRREQTTAQSRNCTNCAHVEKDPHSHYCRYCGAHLPLPGHQPENGNGS